jgi:hypothetical protein
MPHNSLSTEQAEPFTLNSSPGWRVIVDGKKTQYIFDIEALAASVEHDGVFPILNCECGEFGCGGVSVTVQSSRGVVSWVRFSPIQGEDHVHGQNEHVLAPPPTFSREEYFMLVRKLTSTARARAGTSEQSTP